MKTLAKYLGDLERLRMVFVYTILCASFALSTTAQPVCNTVYVKAGGATSGASAGTKANPASLLYGLSLANASDNKIYMASGTYFVFNAINMKSNVSLEGGFNATTWVKSNSTTTTIFRDNSNEEFSPRRLVAMYCTNITNFRLQDLTIQCSNAFASGASSYGVYMTTCSNYDIVRCKIRSGNGGSGANGTNGNDTVPVVAGQAGTIGENGDEQDACCTLGGVGGAGSFTGSYAGGDAGDGAARGTASCSVCGDPTDASNGFPGLAGLGPGGGIGGSGGAKVVVCIYPISCKRKPVNDGQPGVEGTPGIPGSPGANGSALFGGGYYFPGNGTAGTVATHGSGGGGGGGGGSLGGIPFDCLFGLPPNWNGAGAGGGGGGEGGEGGQGGTGATGGGASFAVYIDNNGANGVIRDCQLTPGKPGLGGLGGLGGVGGMGGLGGLGGGIANCNIGAGGNGGQGGQGGQGGEGGRGSDGIAFALYEDPIGVQVSLMNINSLAQPIVSLNFGGCTYMPVEFSTTASGTANWFFGAGSTPSSDIANPATASYTTTGRKTFTLVNNGIPYTYSDFIQISGDGTGLNPSIDIFTVGAPDDTITICEGFTASFGSFLTGASSYLWYIEQDSTWDTLTGFTIIDTFNTVGVFKVIHKTVNSCCGISFPDTAYVVVNPIEQPSISIQAADSSNTVCAGTNLTFSASSSNVTQPQYQWYVNGVASGLNSPTFSISTLANGDSIFCTVQTTSGCSSGLMDSSNTVTVSVVDFPVISCGADTFLSGQPTYFWANVDSGGIPPYTYTWDFGDQTMGSGMTVAHIYQEAGVYDYQVNVVDANGCPGSCSYPIAVFSVLNSQFSSTPFNGCAPLLVQFTNESSNAITYLWEFGDGSTSTETNPSYTYNNPGTYQVTLNAFSSSGTDSSI
ncbi:MAG: PKD domain-containing protein, partial [Flavobacteriales bacterium]|nr:PKD domain-containing protein [Flavobacteriales bacterium]